MMLNLLKDFLKSVGYLWNIVYPWDHMFEKVEDVPDYYKEVIPVSIFFILLEQFVLFLQGKNTMRLNDTVTNIGQGILMELTKIPLHGVELIVYTWVYNNWRIFTLPWNSVWTFIICAVGCDFAFYWVHRAVHQVSIFWAVHETHHSSEEYNLTIPFRLSIFHTSTLWVTYVPLALAIPPSIFFVHYQLNIIFQYWLHTKTIDNVGIFEYVFVTPSHHRVHHGRNRRCIDKNFGSLFIIWDRLFGTFEPEGKESITYGVTKPLETFSPVVIQFNHFRYVWNRLKTEKGFSNKISYLFKGPGWSPGKPWCGNIEDIPEPKEGEPMYDPKLPPYLKIYIILHTTALVMGNLLMIMNLSKTPSFIFAVGSSYTVITTIGVGRLLDSRESGPVVETLRCFLYFFMDVILEKQYGNSYILLTISMFYFRCLFLCSLLYWSFAFPYFVRYAAKRISAIFRTLCPSYMQRTFRKKKPIY